MKRSSSRTPNVSRLMRGGHCAIAFTAMLSVAPSPARSQAGGYATDQTVANTLAAVDSTLRSELRRYDVHGAALAVVYRGRVMMSRGYGVADTAGTPVDPDRTAFGISSMSKVFTTIAVLQLVDRGLIKLADPVTRHVTDVPIGGFSGRAVTVADLLTHSAGFDEAGIGIAARTSASIVPLGDYLARSMPLRVRPAGDVTSYSNHGFALAGLMLERITRQPFAVYLRSNVFDSLGMASSGFDQPLAADLERRRALPLRRRAGGALTTVPRIFFNDAPASAMFTTAGDMSRFMIDFLDTGGGRRRLLSDSSFMRMVQPQFRNHPAVRGLTFGFRERRDGAVQSVEQGGDWQDYSSDLLLAPASGLGLFLALSGDAADRIAPLLWRQLLEAAGLLSGAEAAPPHARTAPETELARVAGTYRVNRYSRHTLARLGVLTGAIRHERVTREGSVLRGVGGSLAFVSPGVYMLDRSKSIVAFRVRENAGNATHLFFENSPYAAYERVEWFDDGRVHLAAFGLCVVAFIATLVSLRNDPSGRPTGRISHVHRRVAALTAAVDLGFLLATGALLATVDVWEFQYGVPLRVRVVLLTAFLVAALAAATVVTSIVVVAGRDGTAGWRVRCVAQAVTAVLFVGLLSYWQLL